MRLFFTLAFFAALSLAVGIMLSGDDQDVDWLVAGGLFGVALAGEGVRLWLRRGRARSRESSGI
ncbi:hypothetical protein [Kribbella sp. CA-247076]|uniref:hypothetical protein n=1 Tax=Kribbella sp. CA-247076 TaxID=3239941 RepID=UPI003D8AA477